MLKQKIQALASRARQSAALGVLRRGPLAHFHSDHYLRHNQRRLEHLASLGLDLLGKSVLEVGAGVGDHTSFFIDRGCNVLVTEARPENIAILRRRFPSVRVETLDMDNLAGAPPRSAQIVYCYGLLYHLRDPGTALRYMGECCTDMMLLETCVSYGDQEEINSCYEPPEDPTQSFVAVGCRPTRRWIFNRLRESFPHVYMPTTQPNHPEFPLDWQTPATPAAQFTRAVFVASRKPIVSSVLKEEIPMVQVRH